MMSITNVHVRYHRNSVVEAAPMKDELVLFHPVTNQFSLLNQTMAFIWSKAENAITADEIAEQVSRSFAGAAPDRVRADVNDAIRKMLELNLLVTAGDA